MPQGADLMTLNRVLHDHDVAISVLPAGEFDNAIADGADRRTHGGAVIDSCVLTPVLEDRMEAHSEGRSDAVPG